MRLILLPLLLFFCQVFLAQSNSFEFEKCPLSFKESDTELPIGSKEMIDSAWDIISNDDKIQFNCITATEKLELSEPKQYKLSLARSKEIERYLYEKSIDSRYVSYNIDYFDHLTNGRCGSKENIKSFKNLKGIISPVLNKGTYHRRRYNSSESSSISETCQEYIINPLNENVIEGRQKTAIKFPSQCFDIDYSSQELRLKVILCEYYSVKDIVLSGLTTVSNDLTLETGGMIYLDVSLNGQKVNLKKGSSLQVVFPFQSEEVKSGMRGFDGVAQDGLINWKLNKKAEVKSTLDDKSNAGNVEFDFEMEGEGFDYENNNFWNVDGYLMSTNNIGWINCDRFLEEINKTSLIVKIESNNVNFGTRILMKETMSILPLYNYSPRNEVKQSNLPSGKEAYVFSYTILKDKETALFAYKKIMLGGLSKVKLKPKSMTIKELYSQLDLLTKN